MDIHQTGDAVLIIVPSYGGNHGRQTKETGWNIMPYSPRAGAFASRGAGRGGRRTGFAVLVIIIRARGTASVIAAALLAGAFFVVVIFHCITSILYSARVGGYTHGKHRTPDVMFCRM